MIKNLIIQLLFKLLGVNQRLAKVYAESEIPSMSTPQEDKEVLRIMMHKHQIALADVADIDSYVLYLNQLILIYQRLRLRSRDSKQNDYLIIIVFLTKHIYELEQSLIRYRKMDQQMILKVRKERIIKKRAKN